MSRSFKAHILLIAVTCVWGSTFVLIKQALVDISPLFFNAVRMALAAIALVLIFRKHMAGMSAGAIRAGIIVGVFLWAGFELQTTGLKLTTPSKSAFLTGVSVVLVPVLLALGWGRRIHAWTAMGVATAFTGLYLLAVPNSGTQFPLAGINRGDMLTIGCAVLFALQIIFMGRAMRKYPFQQIAVIEAAVCALLMFVTVPAVETIYATWSSMVIGAILITGLVNTAAGFTIQAWAQQFTPPTHTALIFSLEPVFAWMTSYVVLKERFGMRAGIGAVLILAGVLISELLGSETVEQEVG